MGSFSPEGGVVAVTGVDPRLVREPFEDALVYVREELREGIGRRLPDATGEEVVGGEQVRRPLRVVVKQRDAAGGMPTEVDHLKGDVAYSNRRSVIHENVSVNG